MAAKKTTAGCLVLALLLFALLFLLRAKREMIDFQVNYEAGKRIRTGETLYRLEDGHYQFKYPPFSSFLYVPLSFLPLVAAKAVWYAIVIASSFFIFFLAFRLVPQKNDGRLWLKILPPLILARYFLREIQLGQINAAITLLLLLMTSFILRDDESRLERTGWSAGILWGFATALKPYALIFFPYFLLKKKWKCLASGTLFLGLAFAAPALFYGWAGNLRVHKEWLSTFSRSTPGLLDSQDNISLIGFLMKWTGNAKLSAMIYGLAIAFLTVLLFLLIRKGQKIARSTVLDSALLLLFIPLLSPLGWDYTLLSSALGVVLIVAFFPEYPPIGRVILGINLFLITFSLYDLLGKNLYAQFMSWSVITVNFMILAGSLAYLRIKKLA
jgi:hypothetical protein